MPFDGSVGFGKDLSQSMDQINDVHQWKRLRSTMAPGFSTRQLGEMFVVTNHCLGFIIYFFNRNLDFWANLCLPVPVLQSFWFLTKDFLFSYHQ